MTSATLKKFAAQNGLRYDPKHFAVFGNFRGYQVMIQDLSNQRQYIVKISVNGGAESQQPGLLAQFLSTLNRPYLNYANYENSTISASVKVSRSSLADLQDLLNVITGYCSSNSMVSCCKYCGAQSDLGIYGLNGQADAMCTSCFQKTMENLSQAQMERKAQKGNLLAGIVGSIVGALIGGALWLLVYQTGYIVGIVGLVIVILAIKGFELLGGKLNAIGLVVSLVVAVVVLFLAEYCSVALEFYKVLQQLSFSYFDILKAMPQLMQESGVTDDFVTELAIGYGLMAVASISCIINYYKNRNLKHELVRLA